MPHDICSSITRCFCSCFRQHICLQVIRRIFDKPDPRQLIEFWRFFFLHTIANVSLIIQIPVEKRKFDDIFKCFLPKYSIILYLSF